MEGGERGRSRADTVDTVAQYPDASAQLRDFFSVCRDTGIQTGHSVIYRAFQCFQLRHVDGVSVFRTRGNACDLTGG